MSTNPDQEGLLNEVNAFLAANADVEQIELLASDIPGNFFSKLFPIRMLPELAKNGLNLPRAMYVLSTVSESMSDDVGLGGEDGDPDIKVAIAPGTLSRITWGDRPRAQALVKSARDDIVVDPREVLRQVIEQYAAHNLRPVVAFELEFTYFDNDRSGAGSLKTVKNPRTGHEDIASMLRADRLDDFETVLTETIKHCDEQGIPTTTICAEFGAGQFEINFPHDTDALQAADFAQLFRRTVKSVARRHGMRASFMAKPDFDRAGNGQHIHVSVLDHAGKNVFSNGDTHTPTLMHAIGGLCATAPEAMSYWAPNINSYRRFMPENCVPTGATWAHEHRHIAFRIPLANGAAWRIENRLPGADANCYLTLATTLAGILHGIVNKINPPAESKGAPEMDYDGFPLTLDDAIHATREGEILGEYLGNDFNALYVNHREGELKSFETFISKRELDWYL